MSQKQIVLYKGEKFASKGAAQFAKDVVKVGRWVHPLTKQEIVFTPERIQKLALNTERFLAAGNRIPFPKGHTTDPTKNLGYWPGPFLTLGDSLLGVVEPKDPVALEAMKAGTLDAVSVCIEFNVVDPKENKYDEVITHVCATSYPVLDGQKGFVALSTLGAEDVHITEELAAKSAEGDKSKEETMSKELALALGLPETATEAEMIKAAVNSRKASDDLKAAQDAQKGSEAKLAKVAEQLATNGFKLEGEKLSRVAILELDVTEKEGDSDELKAFRKNEAVRRQADALSGAKATKDFVTKLSKDMNLPPALQSLAQEVMGVKGELEAVCLSTDGKGLEVKKLEGFPAKVKQLMEGIVSLKGTKLSQQAVETDEAAQRKALAKEVVARVEGKQEEPAAKK